MKIKIEIIGMTLLFVTLTCGGCTQNSSNNQVKEQTIIPTTETIQTILTKAETIESIYYEIAATINMSQFGKQTATIKIWQKLPYLKVQITNIAAGTTNTISIIQRPDGTYTYDITQGKYVQKNDMTSITTALQYLNSDLIKKYLNNQSGTNFETETIDGKQATIIQYSLPQEQNQMAIKIWIWNDKGLPLKAFFTMTLEEYTMTMDFYYSNYSFADIPDNIFKVT